MHAHLVTTVKKHHHPARQVCVYAALLVGPWLLIAGIVLAAVIT